MNTELLQKKYHVTEEEFIAVNSRCDELVNLENTKHCVLANCDCTTKSNKKYFEKIFDGDKEKTEHCMNFLQKMGGHCNCEVLFNAVPRLYSIRKEVDFKE